MPTHHSISSSGNVNVIEVEPTKRIILEFDEIILVNNNNPNDLIRLTDGKLNINIETLYPEN